MFGDRAAHDPRRRHLRAAHRAAHHHARSDQLNCASACMQCPHLKLKTHNTHTLTTQAHRYTHTHTPAYCITQCASTTNCPLPVPDYAGLGVLTCCDGDYYITPKAGCADLRTHTYTHTQLLANINTAARYALHTITYSRCSQPFRLEIFAGVTVIWLGDWNYSAISLCDR